MASSTQPANPATATEQAAPIELPPLPPAAMRDFWGFVLYQRALRAAQLPADYWGPDLIYLDEANPHITIEHELLEAAALYCGWAYATLFLDLVVIPYVREKVRLVALGSNPFG